MSSRPSSPLPPFKEQVVIDLTFSPVKETKVQIPAMIIDLVSPTPKRLTITLPPSSPPSPYVPTSPIQFPLHQPSSPSEFPRIVNPFVTPTSPQAIQLPTRNYVELEEIKRDEDFSFFDLPRKKLLFEDEVSSGSETLGSQDTEDNEPKVYVATKKPRLEKPEDQYGLFTACTFPTETEGEYFYNTQGIKFIRYEKMKDAKGTYFRKPHLG